MSKTREFPESFSPVNIRMMTPEDTVAAGKLPIGTESNMVAEIFIVGEIGGYWGIYGVDVYNALQGKDLALIRVYLSSGGGGVFEAFQIHDILKGHPAPVHIDIFSIAASSGTIISAAGDRVRMSRQSLFMIHEGMAGLWGFYQKKELEQELNLLGKLNNRYIDMQVRKTGMDADHIADLMAMETWFEPEEALEAGFIDEVIDTVSIPFENAAISFDIFQDYFFEHTAKFMQRELRPKGFTRIAANALIKPGKSTEANSNLIKTTTMFGEKLMNFVTGNGWKITDAEGNPVSNEDAVQKMDAAVSDKGSPIAGLLGEEMKNEIVGLVTQTMSTLPVAKAAGNDGDEVFNAIKALGDQFEALNNKVQSLEIAAPVIEETAAVVEKQESRLSEITKHIQSVAVSKSGGNLTADSSGTEIGKDAAPSKTMAFDQNSGLFASLVGQNLVNPNQIAALQQKVNKQRQELGL